MPYDLNLYESSVKCLPSATEAGVREAVRAAGGVCGAMDETRAGNRLLEVFDETSTQPVDLIWLGKTQ